MDRGGHRSEKFEFEDGGDKGFEDPNAIPTRIAMTMPPAASFLADPPLILGGVLATTSSICACFHPFVAAARVLCCSTAWLATCCKFPDDFRIRASRSARIGMMSVRIAFTCAGPTASLGLKVNCCSMDRR